jgi:hypothetical protein
LRLQRSPIGTYVYCLVAASRRPTAARIPRGLPGMGRVRLLDVGRHRVLAVADAPLERYGEDAINRGLSDLDWVARAAIAHEAVVESFIGALAVVPMKLFTIFTSDERALEHMRRQAPRVDAVLRRVANHHEWGVRVVLDRRQIAARAAKRDRAATVSGKGFLVRKKSQRDAAAELARHARDTVADVYDRLAAQAGLAKRRSASELPAQGGPLLLDAAFLIPVKRTARFRRLAEREARTMAPHGYRLTVSGPWPPYSFIED